MASVTPDAELGPRCRAHEPFSLGLRRIRLEPVPVVGHAVFLRRHRPCPDAFLRPKTRSDLKAGPSPTGPPDPRPRFFLAFWKRCTYVAHMSATPAMEAPACHAKQKGRAPYSQLSGVHGEEARLIESSLLTLVRNERADFDQVEVEDAHATLEGLIETSNRRLAEQGLPCLPHRCANSYVRAIMRRGGLGVYACDNDEPTVGDPVEISSVKSFTNKLMKSLKVCPERPGLLFGFRLDFTSSKNHRGKVGRGPRTLLRQGRDLHRDLH